MAKLLNFLRLLAFTASLRYGYCQLNKFITYFEALDYEPMYKQFNKTGRRSDERSIEKILFIDFKAFGKTFQLIVSKDVSTVVPGAKKDPNYHGELHLHPNSLVAGNRIDKIKIVGWIKDPGLWYGIVKSGNSTFYIDPAKKYFKKTRFHSVIYRSEDIENDYQHRLSSNSNFGKSGSKEQAHKIRRRFVANPNVKIDLKVCRLSIEADYSFLKMMGSPFHAITRMVDHVEALNTIFDKSFVNNDRLVNERIFAHQGNDSVIQFQIAKVRVYNESETWRVLGPGALDATAFLRRMQQKARYSQYCLALFFTAHSFMEGVLGVATPRGACTHLNVGVISFRREGMTLPPPLTKIAVAHVVGHAFGAKHDQDSHCQSTGGKNDNFIMTKFALSADQASDSLFSPCSVKQIKAFVKTVQNGLCLQPHSLNQSSCGNSVVEDGEDCDCGGEEMCRILEPGNCCNFTTCKLRTHATCSASNGFCCDGKTCDYKNATDVCSLETECSYQGMCTGNSSKCLQPSQKDNFLCNWNSSVCIKGVCSGKSVCSNFGFEACFCEDQLVDQCKICCLSEDKCLPAQNISKIEPRLKSIYLSAGSLCRNRRGYCDVFHECHPINLNSPFSHRYDPYIRKKEFNKIAHSFWWAIFLGTVGLTACVVVIIKHCALYTKSSCPELSELEPAKPFPRFRLSRLKEEERGIIRTDDVDT